MFERNEGVLDRIVRVVLGLVLLPVGLFLFGGLQGSVFGLVVAGLGVMGLVTGITGVCIVYKPFGISTLEKEKELIAKCKAMMTGERLGSDPNEQPGAEQTCWPCPPSIGKTNHQQG